MEIEKILADRQKTHGNFEENSAIAQDLKVIMRQRDIWKYGLTRDQKEALEMIAHKIGRILAGNPNHKDHWDDIAGYATLISKELK